MSDPIIHFISGLPRSGSTLLAAILGQNPTLQASMSSPVGSIVHSLHQVMGIRSQWSCLITTEQRRRLFASVFHAFYQTENEARIILDTNRMWCARMSMLAELFPGARVIACIRKPEWIINSFEVIFRKHPLLMSRLFTADQGQTVFSRVDALANGDGTFGFALRALKEAYYGEHNHKLVLVDYDALTIDPLGTIKALYAHLKLPPFDHDFERVVFSSGAAFDSHFGLPGLHNVEPRVRPPGRRMLLPPEIMQRFANQDFWNRSQAHPPGVPAILAKDIVLDGK